MSSFQMWIAFLSSLLLCNSCALVYSYPTAYPNSSPPYPHHQAKPWTPSPPPGCHHHTPPQLPPKHRPRRAPPPPPPAAFYFFSPPPPSPPQPHYYPKTPRSLGPLPAPPRTPPRYRLL